MKCNFDYCIYNKNFTCILDEVSIDALGMCEACEVITIPEGELEKHKEKRLKKIGEGSYMKKTCGNCESFRQHYIRYQRVHKYMALAYGHCVEPNVEKRYVTDKACPQWKKAEQCVVGLESELPQELDSVDTK